MITILSTYIIQVIFRSRDKAVGTSFALLRISKMSLTKILNKSGLKGQPCPTPFVHLKNQYCIHPL